ncbi:2-oxo acid dehydrogenase subunit E2 [Motilibacter sp. E257]|uniref:Dihydrolipoamide acetyltransferase component of pyruvate dehydrogenase complex n=1 Tax=Motilibacter deserti TaxID=2714956 RepID=A0ABX0GZ29_9ACTN|nr:2-oxo acid dehydrogenase subunit E2 [Motilibacter deserti]
MRIERHFALPDVGEGLTEAEIVSWRVKPGDTVAVNDVVVEIETAKSLVELPSPYAGEVAALLVEAGATVPVGTPLLLVASEVAEPVEGPAGVPAPGAVELAGEAAGEPVLVGYGTSSAPARRRRRPAAASAPALPAPSTVGRAPAAAVPAATVPAVTAAAGTAHTDHVPAGPPLAKPPVRRLARDLGVDLRAVTPTGPGGTVTREDVEQASAASLAPPLGAASAAPLAAATGAEADEQRIPVRGVRRSTAEAMVRSAFTAPHVTVFQTVDVTLTMELLDRLKARPELSDVRVTPLVLVARALLLAIRRNPAINATWDDPAQEIVVKRRVNLGIAAATPRGLLVPNVKNADAMALPELARALQDLTTKAREGRMQPADMQGGTITITNVGVFGIDTGTPILNPGEAAILALGAIRWMPWVVGSGDDRRIEPRRVVELAVSFDHRMVDGELGARFLADVAAVLADPDVALVWS